MSTTLLTPQMQALTQYLKRLMRQHNNELHERLD